MAVFWSIIMLKKFLIAIALSSLSVTSAYAHHCEQHSCICDVKYCSWYNPNASDDEEDNSSDNVGAIVF